MACNKNPKFLTDRQFADIIKNAPLVSIDLIIRDQDDRVLLQYRRDRPAQGCWFVPGGRIRKYESVEDAITRIGKDEIQKTFSDIKIDPNKCRLLNVYKHCYKKDNKYTDDASFPDMKDEDTHYVSIAKDYKIRHVGEDRCGEEDNPKLKWWTINELLCSVSVNKYTKAFFLKNFHTPNDSQLYNALMAHYIHYDSQFWSRTQIILAIQGATFVGVWTTLGTILSPILMFCTAGLLLLLGILIYRDYKNSRVNEKIMDEIGYRLFHNYGSLVPGVRPISLREETIRKKKCLSGKVIIGATLSLLFSLNLCLGSLLLCNPKRFNYLKETTAGKKIVTLMSSEKNILHNITLKRDAVKNRRAP